MEKYEINAVEMTRKIRDEIYRQTKNLTSNQLMAYYQSQAQSPHTKAQRNNRPIKIKRVLKLAKSSL